MILDTDREPRGVTGEPISLECPYCDVFAHMSPQSVPNPASLRHAKPKQVGLVYQCDACHAPVFLRFAVKRYTDKRVELYRNFVELERPPERFAFSYLPKHTEVLFREALACYTSNNFNAFVSMCRRASFSAFEHLGEGGKLRAFEETIAAKQLAGIDDQIYSKLKSILFDPGEEENLPLLNRAQAGILLELLKDMFYQCFVRHGKLTRALKVRRIFIDKPNGDLKSTA